MAYIPKQIGVGASPMIKASNTKNRPRKSKGAGILSGKLQPSAGVSTGNAQYDALLKLQQQQGSLTDLERLRQQLLQGDSLNDATRQLQRGFLSNSNRTFNLLG